MIPIRDANPTHRRAWVTLGLIGINVAAFFLWQPFGGSPEEQGRFFFCHGGIPDELSDLQTIPELNALCGGKSAIVSLFTSMFLHGDLLHLGGNMLYLWVFGNNVEDRMGRAVFLPFYLTAGVVATYSHVLIDPSSQIPLVGASGAVAGTLGAYLVMFPHARVLTLVPIFFFLQMLELRAVFVLGFWFVLQVIQQTIGPESAEGGGVAWAAHIGGFVFGALVALLFFRARREPAPYLRY